MTKLSVKTLVVLEEYLRSFVNTHKHDDWDQQLLVAEFAYNSSTHASHRHTPFYLNYGRNPRVPADVVVYWSKVKLSEEC